MSSPACRGLYAMTPTTQTSPPAQAPRAEAFDVERIRRDFPILERQVHGKPLVYLDNAATAQKPRAVIETLDRYYRQTNANIHRGVHRLSEEATAEYERARVKLGRFINAPEPEHETIFVRGCTEGMNLVAQSFGRENLGPGDEVLITHMEHHSGIVPWQIVCEQTGARLKVAPIDDRGELIMEEFEKLLNERTKIVSAVHVSNALGTINPVAQMTELAKHVGATVLIDGAQAVPHMPVDVRAIGCDFYAFSGHKMFGPTGAGVLWGRRELLEEMPPYQGGGEMIKSVTFEKTVYNDPPHRFEAGTPHIAGGIGLGAAVDYVNAIDFTGAAAWEREVLHYGAARLDEVEGLRVIGTASNKAGVLAFVMDGAHPYDIAPVLDHFGVAVRTGHHCCQPIMDRYKIPATVRASLAFYNTKEEIDALAEGLAKVKQIFG